MATSKRAKPIPKAIRDKYSVLVESLKNPNESSFAASMVEECLKQYTNCDDPKEKRQWSKMAFEWTHHVLRSEKGTDAAKLMELEDRLEDIVGDGGSLDDL